MGTNLQDQPLTLLFYAIEPTLPSSTNNTLNESGIGSGGYLSLAQIAGPDAALALTEQLVSSVSERARDIVAMGGFASLSGMEKVLRDQATSFARSDSSYPSPTMVARNVRNSGG